MRPDGPIGAGLVHNPQSDVQSFVAELATVSDHQDLDHDMPNATSVSKAHVVAELAATRQEDIDHPMPDATVSEQDDVDSDGDVKMAEAEEVDSDGDVKMKDSK